MRLKLRHRNARRLVAGTVAFAMAGAALLSGRAQDSTIRYGQRVPSSVRFMCQRALNYLATTQQPDGSWPGAESGPGITGVCIMAFLATGDDPDFGPHADNIRRALRNLILHQDPKTGHLSGPGHGPMYHHGLATLALSEAYGVVNERQLWRDVNVPPEKRRTVGQALELAVRCILTSQKQNPYKAWRYSPDSRDADTTVSGTVFMGLLGARNAGVEIPNLAVNNAIAYFQLNTMADGNVSYQPANSHGDGITRTAIATTVYSVAKRKDTKEYRASAEFLKNRIDVDVEEHPFYHRYYMAQALFQSDLDAWEAWNEQLIQRLQKMQEPDGSFASGHGRAYGTGMSVLALALNYRLLPVYER